MLVDSRGAAYAEPEGDRGRVSPPLGNRLGRGVSLLATAALAGCMMIDRARFEADIPLAAPAILSDSTRFGTMQGSVGLRVSDGQIGEPDGANDWRMYPLGISGQFHLGYARRNALVAGAAWGGSASFWGGAVSAIPVGSVRCDLEFLGGVTYGDLDIQGHDPDDMSVVDGVVMIDTLRGVRSKGHSWFQVAMRARGERKGPWAELRFIPVFPLITLYKQDQVMELQDDTIPGMRMEAFWSVSSATVGWIFPLGSGRTLCTGIRGVSVDGSRPDWHGVFSLQHPFP